MRWPVKDLFRWKYGFAYFPKTIGDRVIWWEKYAYRSLKSSEVPESHRQYLAPYWYEEFSLQDGYIAWRKGTLIIGSLAHISHQWIEPPKNNHLRIVS